MSEPEMMDRRSFLNKGSKLALSLLGLGVLAGFYSTRGERFWYEINEIQLTVQHLPDVFKGWKVVQISDIHLGFHYGVEDFRRVVKMVNDLNPDILFLTGDFIEVRFPTPEIAIPLLKELKASRGGKWAVLGNHDFFPREKVIQSFQASDFMLLQNSRGHIEVDGQRLYIAGLEDALNGRPDLEKTLVGLTEEDCVLLLVHEPDIADLNSQYPISAQFSGHSHGGQVRIPFWGPVLPQRYAEKYVAGLYYIGEKKMPLYVNRGIGTTHLPIRLSCRPEITVFYLH